MSCENKKVIECVVWCVKIQKKNFFSQISAGEGGQGRGQLVLVGLAVVIDQAKQIAMHHETLRQVHFCVFVCVCVCVCVCV